MSAELTTLLHDAVRMHQVGDLAHARQAYEAVLRIDPGQPDALHLLGVLLDQAGDHAGAIDLIGRAIVLAPRQPEMHGNLATALLAAGRAEEAEAQYRVAIGIAPRYAEGHYNLANLLRAQGRAREAVDAFTATLAVQPGHVQARNNLAMLLWEDLDDAAGAERQFRLLLSLAPDWATGHMNFGLFRLGSGMFDEGWREYEWRWRSEVYNERDWGLGLPRWTGERMDGGRLLVWGEQGVGDQILYGTMLRDVGRLIAAPMTVAVDERLVDLFRRSLAPHGIDVVARGARVAATAQCPFGSLGRWVRRRSQDFAGQGGYLAADRQRTSRLRHGYETLAAGRRLVGISWRSVNRTIGAEKSVPLDALIPLLRTPGILWIDLQYGEHAAELAALRSAGIAIHADPGIDGFRDLDGFAAQVAALDGVVTVSNTSVHVAGALGVPARLLLAAGRGRLWYWPGQGEGAMWYDSVHIARQHQPGDWGSALAGLGLLSL